MHALQLLTKCNLSNTIQWPLLSVNLEIPNNNRVTCLMPKMKMKQIFIKRTHNVRGGVVSVPKPNSYVKAFKPNS